MVLVETCIANWDSKLCLNSVSKVFFITWLHHLVGFGTILQKPAVCYIVPLGVHTPLPQYPSDFGNYHPHPVLVHFPIIVSQPVKCKFLYCILKKNCNTLSTYLTKSMSSADVWKCWYSSLGHEGCQAATQVDGPATAKRRQTKTVQSIAWYSQLPLSGRPQIQQSLFS